MQVAVRVVEHVGAHEGSTAKRWIPSHKTIEEARSIERDADPIAVYRPHSTNIWTAGSRSEIHLHLALVEYQRETFGVCRFNLYGSSGSGAVVAAVAQERPHLTATVGLALPLLAVKAA